MGIVYKARHQLMGRTVAIKMLPKHLFGDPLKLKRFEQEARAVSNLNHPNIVSIHDFGTLPSGEPYLVMDFLDGTSLFEQLRQEGPIVWTAALVIFTQIAAALSHAHKSNIVHRDIKSSNIMLSRDSAGGWLVTLVDFGIARVLTSADSADLRLTQAGETFGSPVYMSPEQIVGREVDARSDIYSLGCLMYETLTGQPPFAGSSAADTASRHLSQKVEPIAKFCPPLEVPTWLEAIMLRALEKDREKRQRSMDELYQALLAGVDCQPAFERRLAVHMVGSPDAGAESAMQRARAAKKLAVSLVFVVAAAAVFFCWSYLFEFASYSERRLKLFAYELNSKPEDPGLLPPMLSLEAVCRRQGRIDEAIALNHKIGALADRHFGADSTQAIQSRLELGRLYELQKNNDKACKIYREALVEIEKKWQTSFVQRLEAGPTKSLADELYTVVQLEAKAKPGEDAHIEFLRRVGYVYTALGDLKQAKKYDEQALNLINKRSNWNDESLNWLFPELAELCLQSREFDKAEQLYKRTIEVFALRMGADNVNVALYHAALGRLYLHEGRYDLAAQENKRSDDIAGKTWYAALRAAHLNAADGFAANLKYKQAAFLFAEMARLEEQYNGRSNPHTLLRLAELYQACGKIDEAIAACKLALSLEAKARAHLKISTLELLANLYVCRKKADCAKAIEIYDHVIALLDQNVNAKRSVKARLRSELAKAYSQSGNYAKAISQFKQSLELLKSPELFDGNRDEDAKTMVANLVGLGNCFMASNQPEKANTAFTQASRIAVAERMPDAELVVVLTCQSNLYVAQKSYYHAERLIKQAIKLCEKPGFADSGKHASALLRYSGILHLTGRAEEAKSIESQARRLEAGG